MSTKRQPSQWKSYQVIDNDTGEVVQGMPFLAPKRFPHPYKKNGIQVNQPALELLASSPDLSRRAMRIIIWIMSQLGRQNAIPLRQSHIAEALNMHKSDVSKGLRELHELATANYRFLPPGNKPIIGASPTLAWKGQSVELEEAIKAENVAFAKLAADRKASQTQDGAAPSINLGTEASSTSGGDDIGAKPVDTVSTESQPPSELSENSSCMEAQS